MRMQIREGPKSDARMNMEVVQHGHEEYLRKFKFIFKIDVYGQELSACTCVGVCTHTHVRV